jgi:site-specific DNA-cytosine methylase
MLLQTFPKCYQLAGTLSAQLQLVSDAVQPLLAKHIGQAIRQSLGMQRPSGVGLA